TRARPQAQRAAQGRRARRASRRRGQAPHGGDPRREKDAPRRARSTVRANARAIHGAAVLAFALALACQKKLDPSPGGGATSTSAPPVAQTSRRTLDVLEQIDDCTFGLDGPLVDLGDPTSRAALGVKARANAPALVERDGATWAKVTTKSLGLTF